MAAGQANGSALRAGVRLKLGALQRKAIFFFSAAITKVSRTARDTSFMYIDATKKFNISLTEKWFAHF
ncbi:hypothetical protein EPB69_09110 [Geobacillus stearothermophilus]|nr:hypothetical protein EPB69_09110 [Geobacillus stearothermophilus]